MQARTLYAHQAICCLISDKFRDLVDEVQALTRMPHVCEPFARRPLSARWGEQALRRMHGTAPRDSVALQVGREGLFSPPVRDALRKSGLQLQGLIGASPVRSPGLEPRAITDAPTYWAKDLLSQESGSFYTRHSTLYILIDDVPGPSGSGGSARIVEFLGSMSVKGAAEYYAWHEDTATGVFFGAKRFVRERKPRRVRNCCWPHPAPGVEAWSTRALVFELHPTDYAQESAEVT